MQMEMPEKDTVQIWLTEDDLDELDISFEEFDYSNTKTRRVVWTLLDAAKEKFNTDFDLTNRTVVEAFPADGRGGCVLRISILPKKQGYYRIHKRDSVKSYIFEFADEDSLLGAAKQIGMFHAPPGGELYSNGGRYRLLLELTPDEQQFAAMMNEYASEKPSGAAALSYTREHWKTVIGENALKIIGV